MQPVKPGYQTTEFWVTIISQIIGVLAVMGVVSPTGATQLIKSISDIVGGLVAIIRQLSIFTIGHGSRVKPLILLEQ